MIQTIRKAWGVPELRKKIVFTLLILLIFRIGNAIPVPYINTTLLGNYLDSMSGTVLGLYNVMSGGAFAEATVFALGVQPYINSSIIIQLLTIAIPALERLARDGGEAGKKKIASITRYATVAIALLQGFGYYMICKNYNILEQQGIWPALVIIVSFVAGSSFVMWLGEQVNEFGVGNGISIILFAGIVARLPVTMGQIWSYFSAAMQSPESYGKYFVFAPLFIILAGVLVWMAINVTNCTDGVDGLCGSLVMTVLLPLAFMVTKSGAADMLLPMIMFVTLAAYLWFNCSPSQMLMGDAGSRALGVFLAVMFFQTKRFSIKRNTSVQIQDIDIKMIKSALYFHFLSIF